MFINGQEVEGMLTVENLRLLLDRALSEAQENKAPDERKFRIAGTMNLRQRPQTSPAIHHSSVGPEGTRG